MLRSFLYLNEPTLNGYLSALEDGLRTAAEHRSSQTSSLGAKGGIAGIGAQGEKGSDDETSRSYEDTSEARFERFMDLCSQNVDRSGWVDIVDGDTDFDAAGAGSLLEFDCEAYVPQMIRSLSSTGGMGQAIQMMQSLGPLLNSMRPGSVELPPSEQVQAVSSVSSLMGDDLVIVGERDDTDWRVTGRLISKNIRDSEVDGPARIVGKVASVIPEGEYKSLLALPGMNLLSREQRRAQAKTGPKPGEEDNWVSGPALTLDILAIYR
ncbi:hypothetical protein [Curtobacterium poinsettiae]|uniref:DUF6414 family protein n=1 Tax=Curtobacterium poinsettiae TaxID=159612 RepID=UPI0021C92271|nr:hypothetical protein [Curtobacterium flaccumfaciens]MCU0152382.1 hypothetical protein [Curtobacterium flaccumfaciens pv. poinsettiae]UXN15641.1 hypothetical protein N8D76_02815 [Curtobacterium flaccumfaciens pv. poinsettiae]